jgi:hypothetical protein
MKGQDGNLYKNKRYKKLRGGLEFILKEIKETIKSSCKINNMVFVSSYYIYKYYLILQVVFGFA